MDNIAVDKHSISLFIIMLFLICFAVGVTFYKYIILQDFTVTQETSDSGPVSD